MGTNLELIGICKAFGGVAALDRVSLAFEPGRVTCIIGPNGAGKTSLFNVATGYLQPDKGTVLINGKEANGMLPYVIARLGVGRLHQESRVFPKLTALENICVASSGNAGESLLGAAVWPMFGRRMERNNVVAAKEHLRFVGLSHKAHALAEKLSFGQQKLLALARLLSAGSQCILLDEPTAGVSHEMIGRLLAAISAVARSGKTVVLIEHNLGVIREIGHWVFLMDMGRIEAFGTPDEVLRDSALCRLFPAI